MVEQLEPSPPASFAAATNVADLSAEIAAQVEKERSDRVSCRHVYGNCYRCNWWAPSNAKDYDNPGMYGLTVTTHTVRKSAFLHVTRGKNGLSIRVV